MHGQSSSVSIDGTCELVRVPSKKGKKYEKVEESRSGGRGR